jgi:hypothetical protein
MEDPERDHRVEFVEALEGQDGDVHAAIVPPLAAASAVTLAHLTAGGAP